MISKHARAYPSLDDVERIVSLAGSLGAHTPETISALVGVNVSDPEGLVQHVREFINQGASLSPLLLVIELNLNVTIDQYPYVPVDVLLEKQDEMGSARLNILLDVGQEPHLIHVEGLSP